MKYIQKNNFDKNKNIEKISNKEIESNVGKESNTGKESNVVKDGKIVKDNNIENNKRLAQDQLIDMYNLKRNMYKRDLITSYMKLTPKERLDKLNERFADLDL